MKRKKKTILGGVLAAVLLLYIGYLGYNETRAYTPPQVERVDLTEVLSQSPVTEYDVIREQTGLGRRAVDDILAAEGPAGILRFQDQYFATPTYGCHFMGVPTTKEESREDSAGQMQFAELVPLRNGDILVSLSTHTLGWRHGHSAIVVDAENGVMLEAAHIGANSVYNDVSIWGRYPAFAVLRPKGLSDADMEKAAAYARENLYDIPYRLLAGVVKSDGVTQCAHLVWSAYDHLGIDLDSDGGLFVTPADILHSDQLELVQVCGIAYPFT